MKFRLGFEHWVFFSCWLVFAFCFCFCFLVNVFAQVFVFCYFWVVYGFLHLFSFLFFFCCLFYTHVVTLFHFESEVYFNILSMQQLSIWSSLLVMVLKFVLVFWGGEGVGEEGGSKKKIKKIIWLNIPNSSSFEQIVILWIISGRHLKKNCFVPVCLYKQ